MNLFDLLKRKNAFDEYAKNMKPLQPVTGSTPNGQEPNVDLVQVDDTGNLAQNPTQVQQPVSTVEKMKTPRGQRLASFLLGTQAPATDSIDTNNDVVSATISESPRVGGVLPNLMNGFKENVNNGFNIENLTDNIGSDGRNKGLAYRIGEGLGTAARVLDSPFGRGLLTAGIVGGTGGSGLEALVYGGNSGVLNQNLRNNDRIYRNALEDEGVDTSNLKGFITKDTYNSLNQGSARYMNAVTRQQATESMNKLRALQVEKQKIINSTLPDLEKAKLIKANAEAQHAEEYMLAKINALNNSGYLGMLNYGLNALRTNVAVAKDARQAAKEEEEKRILEGLLGGGNNTGKVSIKAPNGKIYQIPESEVDEAIKSGGVRI